MSAKDQPGAAASGEDPAAEAGEPVGASAAPEALSAKAMAKQLFDYLLGTFQAALSPDVLSDLGDVLVARGRRSVVLPGGHRAGPPGPFVRGGPALQPYRRGHIEDARDRTGRPRRLQARLMQPGFAHTTNKSLPRPINLALPSLFTQKEVEWHRLLLKYSRREDPGAYWRGGLGSQGPPLDADGNPDSAGVRHGALARDHLFVRPTAKEAEARALAVADTWRGGGGGSVLTRAWRAVAFVTHEEQDLTLCTLMDTRLGAAGRGGEARGGGADRGGEHAAGGAAPREAAVAARQGRPRREALWRVWSSTAIGERRGHS
jgi:hypothetical protein